MNTAPAGAVTPEPQNGEDKKPKAPTVEDFAKALNETDISLEKANGEIQRLKSDAKKSGNPNVNNDQIDELNKTIEGLKGEIDTIKKGTITREETDPLVQEIAGVRKRNSELAAALISKETMGNGSGAGGHQPDPLPETDPNAKETDGERDLRERMEKRRISQGRDPKTGLKIA